MSISKLCICYNSSDWLLGVNIRPMISFVSSLDMFSFQASYVLYLEFD